MTSKKKRTVEHRRDRRKAKASKWARQGKTNMSGKVAHGPTGSPGAPREVRTTGKFPEPPPEKPRLGLKVRLAFFVEDEADDEETKEGDSKD